ncbi:MAG: methionine--tRNA ligase [Candidatus Omnitrophota bacterium]
MKNNFKKFYITTPIYYVNAAPHIGHSYTTIAADALTRYMRGKLNPGSVRFLTGSDEHGQKIQKAADEAGLKPQEFVDKVVVQFKDLWKKLNISNDDFIRTTEHRHIRTVQIILDILRKKGDIYQAEYEGWYCQPCETFWPQTQVTDQLCPDCQRPVEKIKEQNFFFKLSNYQDRLIEHITKNEDFVRPESRRNEVLKFLEQPLTDLCISRPKERLSWGIPLPFSPDHVTYVWFDALVNYLSAVGSFDDKGNYTSDWWQPDCRVVHFMAKDILRQHAVYWPAMLMALRTAGVSGIRLPDTVFAHGWWLMADMKMSKSRGNVVSPFEMINKYGLDTYRYFLLRDVPFGSDGNFSEEAIVKRFNSDLANDLGNLIYRTLTMVEKYYQGEVPRVNILSTAYDAKGEAIKARLKKPLSDEIDAIFQPGQNFNFSQVLEKVWELVNMANKYVEETKPWNLAKEGKADQLKAFIRLLVEVIRDVTMHLYPFMPQTVDIIEEQLGTDIIKKGDPLFPRIDTKRPSPNT